MIVSILSVLKKYSIQSIFFIALTLGILPQTGFTMAINIQKEISKIETEVETQMKTEEGKTSIHFYKKKIEALQALQPREGYEKEISEEILNQIYLKIEQTGKDTPKFTQSDEFPLSASEFLDFFFIRMAIEASPKTNVAQTIPLNEQSAYFIRIQRKPEPSTDGSGHYSYSLIKKGETHEPTHIFDYDSWTGFSHHP